MGQSGEGQATRRRFLVIVFSLWLAAAGLDAAFAQEVSVPRPDTGPSVEDQTRAVAERHLACFENWFAECVHKDFARGTKLVTRFRPLETRQEITAYFSALFDELARPEADFEIEIESIEGDTANLVWSANRDEGLRDAGHHTLKVKGDKITILITTIDVSPDTFFGIKPKEPASSTPEGFLEYEGRALFFADDEIHGEELWSSDGTEEGTFLVKDLTPGPTSSRPGGWAVLEGKPYFCAAERTTPRLDGPRGPAAGLWRTDGTDEGTVRIKSLHIQCGSDPIFAVTRDRIYFVGHDGAHGRELWTSDGTEAGTGMVKDIRKGSEGSKPIQLYGFGDHVYFQADDGRGPKLWKSDGTAKGTVALKSLKGGYDGWHWAFAEFKNELYFTADDGKHGGELWKTNGTSKGTKMVKEIRRGPKGAQLFELNELNGVAYFSATDGKDREVWRTDGTGPGTFSLNVNPDGGSFPDHMRVSAGKAYFYAYDKAYGGELWATDGSVAGTYRVKDIFKGKKGSHPNLLVDLDGTLIFVAEDEVHGMELWRSDGTSKGTVMLRDIEAGPESGRPRHLGRVGSRVFFQANDGKVGVELWATDGTPEGTVLVKNINVTGDGE